MTDYTIFGTTAGPSGTTNLTSFSSGNGSVGVEFYVNQPVYLKAARIWRNSSQYLTGSTNFQLYQVTSSSGFNNVTGGGGNIPAGNNGWMSGQTNPILLQPGTRYKMAFFVGPYVYATNNQFYNGERYVNGVGNSVIWAPGAAQALSAGASQMTYDLNAGYPNTDNQDTNFWIDVTVTDQGFGTPLVLSATAQVGKVAAATAALGLSATETYNKRVTAAPTAYLTLRASGRAFTSDSLIGVGRLALGASGQVTHEASILGEATLALGASGTVSKSLIVTDSADLVLGSPGLSDFFKGVAGNVRDALVTSNWNADRRHFQEAMQTDAEALTADVLGGLMALSTGDHERAHDTVRHLRNFRVKHQNIAGGHYRNPHDLMGYKPHGTLGAQGYASPPDIIDQAATWMAEVFKGNYGEPIGDDVRSLFDWGDTRITPGPSALYGGQFLGVNRTYWAGSYHYVSRPELASAAWALLAALGGNQLFPIDRLPRPEAVGVSLSTTPASGNRDNLNFAWTVTDDVFATVYQNRLEYCTDPYQQNWLPVFEHLQEHQADRVRVSGGYQHVISVPHPAVTTQYRVWIRMRNAYYGDWSCSNVVQLYSTNSTLFPSPTTFPSATTFPQG